MEAYKGLFEERKMKIASPLEIATHLVLLSFNFLYLSYKTWIL